MFLHILPEEVEEEVPGVAPISMDLTGAWGAGNESPRPSRETQTLSKDAELDHLEA